MITVTVTKSPKTGKGFLHFVQGEWEKNNRKKRLSLESNFAHGIAAKMEMCSLGDRNEFEIKPDVKYPVFWEKVEDSIALVVGGPRSGYVDFLSEIIFTKEGQTQFKDFAPLIRKALMEADSEFAEKTKNAVAEMKRSLPNEAEKTKNAVAEMKRSLPNEDEDEDEDMPQLKRQNAMI